LEKLLSIQHDACKKNNNKQDAHDQRTLLKRRHVWRIECLDHSGPPVAGEGEAAGVLVAAGEAVGDGLAEAVAGFD
jgi:hypothetical protein